ncbi:hypothetical protein [Oceanicoccus sagamiensis]|uniref:hypothetical protein n=1 Tax=Oceanicoccus sagamiensis TaxID=716816 RepID=UPI001F0B41FD|nr:hypothetical protein [Oceanicoccus sagamiensis]
MKKPTIKVMIVDDSAVVRQTLSDILNSDDELEVISYAQDPIAAAKKIRDEAPMSLLWMLKCHGWMV